MGIVDLGQYKNEAENLPEVAPAEADSEVKIRIIAVRVDNNKHGNKYIMPTFEIPDNLSAPEFTKYMELPRSDMDARTKAKKIRMLENFGQCFNFDIFSEWDEADLVSLEGWAIVGVEADDEYGDKNYVKRFITGA
jgi:hypothetical protein